MKNSGRNSQDWKNKFAKTAVGNKAAMPPIPGNKNANKRDPVPEQKQSEVPAQQTTETPEEFVAKSIVAANEPIATPVIELAQASPIITAPVIAALPIKEPSAPYVPEAVLINGPIVEPEREIKPPIEQKPDVSFVPAPDVVAHTEEPEFWQRLGITQHEFQELIEFRANHEARSQFWIFMSGVLLMPITLVGVLIGYVRGYNRFMKEKQLLANFYPMRPIVRVAMVIGGVLAWACVVTLAIVAFFIKGVGYRQSVILGYFGLNIVVSFVIYGVFKVWRLVTNNTIFEAHKFGSARWARKDELFTLENEQGYYIGQGHLFNDFGHLLTVAGTRGGKGTNIIIPNLLGAGGIQTSWVVIDPKGENAAITARYQRQAGQNVIVLNPWGLLKENIGGSHSYNPLEIADVNSIHFVDDIQVIAEMIVPVESGAKDPFWTDCARSVVVGLLLFILTEKPKAEQTLGMLWELARLSGKDWDDLIQDMGASMHRQHKKLVRSAANEILKLSAASEETFGGIIASVLQATDFIKSPAMQTGLKSGFDPATLANGKTTVYVVIPADKLKTHSRWLRLVVTSLMRAVIRKPNKRVTFLLDEFAALGYISEIEVALSTYAGYNVTVWPILQTLVQLENLYDNNWQTFISNCTVRQFFSINDSFSANYVSEAIGHTSNLKILSGLFGVKDAEANQRLLVTPDELRRESGKRIFMFIADLPPTYVEKLPYYKVNLLNEKAGENPYVSKTT